MQTSLVDCQLLKGSCSSPSGPQVLHSLLSILRGNLYSSHLLASQSLLQVTYSLKIVHSSPKLAAISLQLFSSYALLFFYSFSLDLLCL